MLCSIWYQRWTIPCSLSWHLLPLKQFGEWPSWTLPGCWWQGDRATAGTNVTCSCFLPRVLPKTAVQSSLLSQGRRYSSSLPLSGSVLQPAFYKLTYFQHLFYLKNLLPFNIPIWTQEIPFLWQLDKRSKEGLQK